MLRPSSSLSPKAASRCPAVGGVSLKHLSRSRQHEVRRFRERPVTDQDLNASEIAVTNHHWNGISWAASVSQPAPPAPEIQKRNHDAFIRKSEGPAHVCRRDRADFPSAD